MALKNTQKTEGGHRNGNGRFVTREEAKTGSRKGRRTADKKSIKNAIDKP